MNDPINPAHYTGTACADIGELMTANCYQVLKYNWRLGKKDAAAVELGKSLWYLDREVDMGARPLLVHAKLWDDMWLSDRLRDQDGHVKRVATGLINYNRHSHMSELTDLRRHICIILAQHNG